jgi:hypothetical protein
VVVLVPVVDGVPEAAVARTVQSALGAGTVRVVAVDGTSAGLGALPGCEHLRVEARGRADVVREALDHLKGSAVVLALPGDELLPGGVDRLVDAAGPAVEAVFGILVVNGGDGGGVLASHLPWDAERLCRRAYLDPLALVLPDAADLVVELAESADGGAWERQRPWVGLAAAGGMARWVPHVVGRVERPDAPAGAGPPAPRALRHRFPNLPWPDEEVAS